MNSYLLLHLRDIFFYILKGYVEDLLDLIDFFLAYVLRERKTYILLVLIGEVQVPLRTILQCLNQAIRMD